MISNVSIQEYARLAHLFRKALDESYAESKLKNYPIFSLFPARNLRRLFLSLIAIHC